MNDNNLERQPLLRATPPDSTLPPRDRLRSRSDQTFRFSRHRPSLAPAPSLVHLLPCDPPHGQLEPAPRSSLHADAPDEQWDGFWCLADEGYYTRCMDAFGREQWYRVADDELAPDDLNGARVLPMRRRGAGLVQDGRRMLLLSSRTGGTNRPILVGTSRRAPAARTRSARTER